MNELEPQEPAPPAAPVTGDRFPWPPAENESIITAVADTWRGASLHPVQFFRALPHSQSFGSALLYYLPLGIAVAGIALFWTTVLGVSDDVSSGLDELGMAGGMSPVIEFLMSPLLLLFSLFVSAGVTHVMLKVLGGAGRDFRTTVCVFAFAYSPQLLGVIPYVGELAGGIWMVVIAIIGLREAHHTSTGRAAAAVLIPLAIALFFIGVAMFIVATTSVLMPS